MLQSRLTSCLAVAALLVGCGRDADDRTLATDEPGMPAAEGPATMPPAPTEQPPAAAEMAETAQLQPLQNSGVSGEATIRDRGAQTEIMVRLTGAPANANHPGHVHSGTCEAVGSVVQPLQPISTDGTGTGTMTATLDRSGMSLMDGQHVIVYHGAGGAPITCAAIPAHRM